MPNSVKRWSWLFVTVLLRPTGVEVMAHRRDATGTVNTAT
jgi:hypothetical protein